MAKLDVVEYQGENQIFIWKYPLENFTYGSQLIVRESQEAIFFMNGKALDLFGPGFNLIFNTKYWIGQLLKFISYIYLTYTLNSYN
jgi:membrane protease subunit (stomatin/prohibitin family)